MTRSDTGAETGPHRPRLGAMVGSLPPELVEELKKHKPKIIRILREDEELRRTGIIQSERQVFGLAREHFGKELG